MLKYEQTEKEGCDYTTVKGDEEKFDREGDKEKANFDTEGGTRDFFDFIDEQCSNSLGSFAANQLGWPVGERGFRAL